MRSVKWLAGFCLSLVSSAALALVPDGDSIDSESRLLLHSESEVHSALLKDTQIEINISGLLVRTRVKQTYTNELSEWAEGIYTFPLPAKAAVDRLQMHVGERIIEGQIQEKTKARETYSQAKKAGKRSSLLEQQRPNIFTTAVANIGPGETVVIEIEYQQQARYDNHQFSVRFPMTVLPRYIPGTPLDPEFAPAEAQASLKFAHAAFGWARATDQVPDAGRITPPVAGPDESSGHRVSLQANLEAGFVLEGVQSRYHRAAIERPSASAAIITLDNNQGRVLADRDFELTWSPVPTEQPTAALLGHEQDGAYYGSIMIMPPSLETTSAPLPKSLTMVLDVSGSMHGDSMRQAKLSLRRAIQRLRPTDRFNVLAFNSATRTLFPRPVVASTVNQQRALAFVNALEAEGGTEMAGAISRALNPLPQKGYVEQVLFVTDGAVGNEDALFNLIEQEMGPQRLFTVGIGSAPNSHFMTKAARLGRGSFTYIGSENEVAERMDQLFTKLDRPRLTRLRLSASQPLLHYPARLPDLYQNEPLVVHFKTAKRPQHLTLSARAQGSPWHQSLPVPEGITNPAIGVVWARARVAHLMDRYRTARAESDKADIRASVIETALDHHLVTRFTSLVAVDVTPVRSPNIPLSQNVQKQRLAKGTSHYKIFGLAKTGTSAPLQLATGALLLMVIALWMLWRRWSRYRQVIPVAPAS